jgi:hypothetical protein
LSLEEWPKRSIIGNMKYLRVVDEAGNNQDYEAELVPRIGERITLEYGRGAEPVRRHYLRVKDVEYRLQNSLEHQAAILVEEETNPKYWPE